MYSLWGHFIYFLFQLQSEDEALARAIALSIMELDETNDRSSSQNAMENLPELTESSGNNSSVTSPTALSPEPSQNIPISTSNDVVSTPE